MEYREKGFEAIYKDYNERREKIKQMGGAKAVEAQHQEGKWSARERVEFFFDPGTFTELGIFVRNRTTAFGMDKREVAAEGVRAARIQEYSNLYENPYRGAERNYIDDVIMPHDTRKYINRCLDILENKSEARPWRKYSNINL